MPVGKQEQQQQHPLHWKRLVVIVVVVVPNYLTRAASGNLGIAFTLCP
jgi:hypothetical protein